jgi:hypothetical protein
MRALSRAVVVAAATGLFALFGGASVVTAFGGSSPTEDGGRAVAGDQLERAQDVALAVTGGGRVTGTEVDDEESRYEVEVTTRDGRQVDVQLDAELDVVSTSLDAADGDGAGG